MLLVAPVWTTQNWYPLLLQLAVEQPILLSRKDNLLTLPHNQELHPLKDSLCLAAWMLSKDRLRLSDDAITIISASWSSGTDKQYNSAWKKWCGWCEERKIHLLQASVDEVVNFLSQSFAEGKSYSTVNTYRSALSSTLLRVFQSPKFCALLVGQMNVHFVNITSKSTLSLNNLFMKFLY